MKQLLWFIRKSKALIFKNKLHILFQPIVSPLLLFSYLMKLSKWIAETPKPVFNDFYSKKFDYPKRYSLYAHVISSEKLERIDYWEFGVSEGHSFRWWVDKIKHARSRFVGFDTFSGLPEKWGLFGKGAMTVQGTPPVIHDSRCEFKKGLFQDTLPQFLKTMLSDSRKVIHLDADMYSSTLYVLTTIAPFLKKGDILIFDEFTVPLHEFKAFLDFTNSYYIQMEMIGAVNNYFQVAFKVK